MQNIASCICIESINGDSTTIISAASASHIETKPGMIISPIANIANKIPQYNIFISIPFALLKAQNVMKMFP